MENVKYDAILPYLSPLISPKDIHFVRFVLFILNSSKTSHFGFPSGINRFCWRVFVPKSFSQHFPKSLSELFRHGAQ